MATFDEIEGYDLEGLRAEARRLRDTLAVERTRFASAEMEKIEVMRSVGSARIRIQSAMAIEHLSRHSPHALSSNARPNIHNELADALRDLEAAQTAANEIPF